MLLRIVKAGGGYRPANGGLVKLHAVSLDKGTASIEDAYDETVNTPSII